MQMHNWVIAMIPPLLVWCGLFLYLMIIDSRVRAAEARLRSRDNMPYPRP